MSFSDKLLLWFHIGFAIFALGPLTLVTGYLPRYIRAKDLGVLRFLKRAGRLFGSLTLGVFLFGVLLGRGNLGMVYLTVSMTLFIVAALLLVIVDRDVSKAVRVLESESPDDDVQAQSGRIAALGGVTSLIWLVILALMVFYNPGD